MASVDYLLTNAYRVNWLKGALAMDITDEAIRPFVEKEIKTFHTDIKSNFRHGSLCGKCKSTNAKHCHSGKCSDITSHIESAHRFKGPCYKNSDITKWLSDPWEIAKCYMSRSKDLEGQPESDIDFSSLLNIIINNKRFERLITKVDMTNENNVFCQGRNARNKTMHSKGHQMTDTDLKDYCDIFIEIVNLIGAFSKLNVKKIEKVRDTPLSITAEEIVNLKEKAARYRELTEDVIEKMKTKMWEEAKQMIKYIKDEAEKVIGTSFIANFIEGCKESLYILTVEHVQRQRPDDIEEDEWTVSKFIDCLRIFPDTNNLSPRLKAILFRNTHTKEDIGKWDPFLLCCILQIELRVPVASKVILYVNNVKQIRDELLHNRVEQKDLLKLCDYLDDPLKSDTLRIYNNKYTVLETLHANNDLVSWHAEEDAFSNNDRYRRADIERNRSDKKIIDIEQRMLAMEQKQLKRDSGSGVNTKSRDINRDEDIQAERATGGIAATSYEVNVNIVPQNVSQKEKDILHNSMTNPERNNAICNQISFTKEFNSKTGCKPNGIVHGSILLKVECRSVESMVGFWKGCTDGTVVKAMSTIRDAYRRYLGNDKLEFDTVLKRCEVIRCRNKILENLNLRLEQLKEQLTDVDNLINPPEMEETPLQTELQTVDDGHNVSVDDGQNVSVDDGQNVSVEDGQDVSVDDVQNASVDDGQNVSVHDGQNMPVDNGQNVSVDDGQNVSVDDGHIESVKAGQNVSVDDEQNVSVDDGHNVSVDDEQNMSVEDGHNVSVDDGQNASVDDGQNVSVHDGQNMPVHDGQNMSVDDGQNVSVDDGHNESVEAGQNVSVDDEQNVSVDDGHNESVDDEQNMSVEDGHNVSVDDGQNVSVDDGQNVSVDDGQNMSVDDVQNVSVDNGQYVSVDNGQNVSVDDEQNESVDDGQNVSVDDGHTLSVDDGQNVSVDDGQNMSVDDGQNVSVDDGQNASVDDGQNVSVDDGQNMSVDDVHNVSVDNGQNMSVDDEQNESVDNGHNVSVDDGHTLSVDDGQNVSVDNVQNVSVDDGHKVSVDDGQNASVDDGQNVSVDDRQNMSVDDVQNVSIDSGQYMSVDNGQNVSVDDEQNESVDDGQNVSVDDGHTLSVDDGHNLSVDDGHNVSVDDGQSESVEDGHNVSVDDGHNVSVDDEQNESVDDGHTLSVDNGQNVSVDDGQNMSVDDVHNVSVDDGQNMSVDDGQNVSVDDGQNVSVDNGQNMSVDDGRNVSVVKM